VVQFVPLKVDTDGGEAWQKWASKYQHEGNGIPIVYVIRADGQKMYGKSGGMGGDALKLFMVQQLQQAGRVLTEEDSAKLTEALDKAKKALEAGKPNEAVQAVAATKKIGSPGSLGSYAKVAVETDQLVKKLLGEAKARITDAQQKVSTGDAPFDAVLTLVEAKRVYAAFPELKVELVAATRALNKDEKARELLKQAEALDRARGCLDLPNGQSRAATALRKLIEQHPDGPAAELAKKELEKLPGGAGETPAVATRPAAPRGTADSDGAASDSPPSGAAARRKAASSLKMAKVFLSSRPDKAKKYAEEVIDLSPQSAEAEEAKALLEQLK
jgi:tetratricopeptide (TPR) repeat protein